MNYFKKQVRNCRAKNNLKYALFHKAAPAPVTSRFCVALYMPGWSQGPCYGVFNKCSGKWPRL